MQETTTAKLGVDDLKLAVSALSTQIKQQSGRDSITNDPWTIRLAVISAPLCFIVYVLWKRTRHYQRFVSCNDPSHPH